MFFNLFISFRLVILKRKIYLFINFIILSFCYYTCPVHKKRKKNTEMTLYRKIVLTIVIVFHLFIQSNDPLNSPLSRTTGHCVIQINYEKKVTHTHLKCIKLYLLLLSYVADHTLQYGQQPYRRRSD